MKYLLIFLLLTSHSLAQNRAERKRRVNNITHIRKVLARKGLYPDSLMAYKKKIVDDSTSVSLIVLEADAKAFKTEMEGVDSIERERNRLQAQQAIDRADCTTLGNFNKSICYLLKSSLGM